MRAWLNTRTGSLSGWEVPAALVCALTSVHASAEPPPSLGDTSSALPGIFRVGVAASGGPRYAVSGTAGYAYTDSQVTDVTAHHRLGGTLAVAVAPVSSLEFALRFDGRYDWHPGPDETDRGLVGDPRILGRAGTIVAKQLHLGAELGLWLPGANAPSLQLDATSADVKLLGAWVAAGDGLTIAGLAGFRYDRSANSAEEARRLSPSDRLSLGVSDFHAALVGAGLGYRFGATELLLEGTADILVGSAAPKLGESPLRVSFGPRYHLSEQLAVQLRGEVSPSSHPGVAAGDPLVPLEPRVAVMAGIGYRGTWIAAPKASKPVEPPPEVKPEPKPPPPALITETTVRGSVTDGLGTPIGNASVRLQVADHTAEGTTGEDGSLVLEKVPVGKGTVTVAAPGFKTVKRPFEVPARKEATLVTSLEADLPAAQIRGMIRSFQGKGIAARIVVEPAGIETTADEKGYFQIDVEPGVYEITVSAEGYVKQRRTLKVGEGAVVVFNADLTKKPKR